MKVRFYHLLTAHALAMENYLNCAKYQWEIYDTKSTKDNEEDAMIVISKVVLFTILAEFDNEQSDLLHRLLKDKFMEKITFYQYHQIHHNYTC